MMIMMPSIRVAGNAITDSRRKIIKQTPGEKNQHLQKNIIK
jgi:hypothetical protein